METYLLQFSGEPTGDEIQYQFYLDRFHTYRNDDDTPLSLQAFIELDRQWDREYDSYWRDWGNTPGVPPRARQLEYLLVV